MIKDFDNSNIWAISGLASTYCLFPSILVAFLSFSVYQITLGCILDILDITLLALVSMKNNKVFQVTDPV